MWLRYRVDRALARLAPPLALALTAVAPGAGLAPADVLPMARTLVRGAVAAADPRAYGAVLPGLARASVATLLEHLFALAVPAEPKAQALGLVRELEAFREALEPGIS
jgi:hypothetical protein